MIKCDICGMKCKSFHGLGKHIKTHLLSCKQYYDKYIKIFECEGLCDVCGKETTFQSITNGYQKYCSCKCSAIGYPKFTNPEIISKIKKSNLKKFGVDNPFKSAKIQTQIQKTNIRKYGADNPSKNKKVIHKIRIKAINRIESQKLNGEPLMPCIGINERYCLDILESTIDNAIIRNRQIDGFFPDGRIENTYILIEFDEPFHFDFDGNLKPTDIDRQKYLETKGYQFFRVSQQEWEENPKKIITQFQQLVKELEC